MTSFRADRSCRKRSRRPVRRGFTLVELATGIALTSLLLSLVTVVVLRIMGLESKTRDHIQNILTHSQLSDQLRDDVHAATKVVVSSRTADQTALAIWLMESRRVEYTFVEGSIQRLVRHQEQVESRERFRVPQHSVVSWSRDSMDAAEFVRLEIESQSKRPVLTISAQVGRHRVNSPAATAAVEAEQAN